MDLRDRHIVNLGPHQRRKYHRKHREYRVILFNDADILRFELDTKCIGGESLEYCSQRVRSCRVSKCFVPMQTFLFPYYLPTYINWNIV